MPPSRNKFEETIDSLVEELALAIKWGRPSILLAIHKSEHSQRKAENVLKSKLQKTGINVIEIQVNAESPDVVRSILANLADPEKNVFFISNIDQGGGEDGRNAYRALNLYRETFIENKIKVVFWLTGNEELKIPKYAPDFWAFRHRVVEFSSTHQSKDATPPSGLLLWGMKKPDTLSGTLAEKINARNQLLGELPDGLESLSSRIELLYTLGFFHWLSGDVRQSEEELSRAADLAKRDEFLDLQIQLLNALAILSYEKGDYQRAYDIYADITNKTLKNSLIYMNQAVVLSALGKNYLAVVQAGKALKLDPQNAEVLFSLGYLFFMLGKLDEAADLLKKSIHFAPGEAQFHEMLGICYNKMGLPEEARGQLEQAVQLGGERVVYSKICREFLLGNPEKASSELKNAVINGMVPGHDVFRDPILNIVLDDSLISQLQVDRNKDGL
jgi:tetratricopeptide (TPR) repeat protein